MEIIHQSRSYREVDGELKFYRNTFILKNDTAFFYATSSERLPQGDAVDIDELAVYPIPIEDIYPLFSPKWTLAPDTPPQPCHIKHPDLLSYNPDAPVGRRPCDTLTTEIGICELLKENPHPNIAQYLGCTVHDGRVTGLVFSKYGITLGNRFEPEHGPLRPEVYLAGIENGLRHLHGLGLVHNDINPENIMLRDDDTPVIIDFDTCQREGEECRSAGTDPWCLDNMEFAVQENDYYGLEKIREALQKGKLPDDEEPSE